MGRLKRIRRSEFEGVFEEDWKPVTLEGDAIPSFARGFPPALRCVFIASGQYAASADYSVRGLPGARLVGGIDVWRDAPDDPVPYNKDWYAVLSAESEPDWLYLDGPQKDSEHWHDRIPARYVGIKVIGRDDEDE